MNKEEKWVKETVISRLSVLCCTLPATPFATVFLVPIYTILFSLLVRAILKIFENFLFCLAGVKVNRRVSKQLRWRPRIHELKAHLL